MKRTDINSCSVAIIGAGFGGLAAAYYLQKNGINDFVIFEKSAGIGGTWHDNRYPGAACDVQSALYSFSFAQKTDWTRVHATQPEILAYIEDTAEKLGVKDKIRLNEGVSCIEWQEEQLGWNLHTTQGYKGFFKTVISAVGMLNEPNEPNFPGLSSFRGQWFHTARWPEIDLRDKTVAVVGAGSSAAQVIPSLAPLAKKLIVYQREPGWVLPNPAGDKPLPAEVIERNIRYPFFVRMQRYKIFWQRELIAGVVNPDSKANRKRAAAARQWLEASVEAPATRANLSPSYPFNCKRPTRDPNFLAAFNRENVELIPYAVTRFTENTVVASDGSERKADAIVFAIGFKAQQFLSSFRVVGANRRDLHEEWEKLGGPEAFLGVTVSGFPNLFLMYGPNTNSSSNSIIFNLEQQASYIARAVSKIKAGAVSRVEVRREVQRRFNKWLHKNMDKTTFVAECNNYYRTSSGKQVTNWPYPALLYALMLRVFRVGFPGLYAKRSGGGDRPS